MKKIVLAAAILCFAFSISAKSIKLNFDSGKFEKEWSIENDAVISAEQKHSGTKSLKIIPKSVVSYVFSDKDAFGKVTMWVYDTGGKPDSKELSANNGYGFGSLWGAMNADEDKLVFGQIWASWIKGNETYNWASSAASADSGGWNWASRYYTTFKRSTGWHKWTIDMPNKNEIEITMDDTDCRDGFKAETAKFNKGFAGLYFEGGAKNAVVQDPVYIDDIDIQTK